LNNLITSPGALTTPMLYPCWKAEPKAAAAMANDNRPFNPYQSEINENDVINKVNGKVIRTEFHL